MFLASYADLWWPNIGPKMGFPELFEKKLLTQFISYLAFILIGWDSWPLYILVFLDSYLALWWPNIGPKMGFLELFEKTIGSIDFIPGIYPYGMSLLTPIDFRVTSLIFSPSVAKYLAEKWGFRNFLKKLLAQFISYLAFILMAWVSWTLYIFVFLDSFLVLWWLDIWPIIGVPRLYLFFPELYFLCF